MLSLCSAVLILFESDDGDQFALLRRVEHIVGRRRFTSETDGEFSEYVVTEKELRKDMEAMFAKADELSSLDSDGSLDRVLSDEEIGRMRFAHRMQMIDTFEWRILGERWSRGIFLYLSVLPEAVRSSVSYYLDKLKIRKIKRESGLFDILKTLGAIAKRYGKMFSSSWKFLINLELLGGYKDAIPIEEFVEDVKQWVSGDIVHESLGEDGVMSEENFLSDLSEGMGIILSDLPNLEFANKNLLSIADFSSDPGNWARSGATSQKVSPIATIDGQQVKLKGTKWRSALALKAEEVERMITGDFPDSIRQRNKAIEKREAGKVRAVVNSDDYLYLKMTYVSTWLEIALIGNKHSSLFMRSEQLQDMWVQMGLEMRGESWALPLDQSHFDWQQNMRMISRFCDVVNHIIVKFCVSQHKQELLSVMALIKKSLVEGGSVTVGSEVIRIEKGVLSGWRWTALMDTVFNFGEFYAALGFLKSLDIRPKVVSLICQGDDDRVLVRTPADAVAIVKSYAAMNFEVNPTKFFIDQHRDEFLRQVAEINEVSGYCARGVNAILWRNPISMDPAEGDVRIRELVSSWFTLVGRGANWLRVKAMMFSDIRGSLKQGVSDDLLERWLRTPASVGGMGAIIPYVRNAVILQPGTLVNKLEIDPRSVVGLDRVIQKWGALVGDKEIKTFASSVLNAPRMMDLTSPTHFIEVKLDYPKIGEIVLVDKLKNKVPRWRKDLPSTLRSEVLSRLIKEKKFQDIFSLLEPESREGAKNLWGKMTRRVWLDWVQGKLPFSVPFVLGWSIPYVSSIFAKITNFELGNLFLRHHITYSDVVNCAIICELKLHQLLRKSVVKIGG